MNHGYFLIRLKDALNCFLVKLLRFGSHYISKFYDFVVIWIDIMSDPELFISIFLSIH